MPILLLLLANVLAGNTEIIGYDSLEDEKAPICSNKNFAAIRLCKWRPSLVILDPENSIRIPDAHGELKSSLVLNNLLAYRLLSQPLKYGIVFQE